MKMTNLVGSHIETLKPYVPGKPIEELKRELGVENPIKLASNENPLGPSPKAMEAMSRRMEDVHYYPDGAAHSMIQSIAAFHDVPVEQVITGNGSNELLTLVVRTFCDSGVHSAVVSEFSFAAYAIICQAHNLDIRRVPMAPGYCFDLDAMADAIDETTKVVFIANPNNPTGTYVGKQDLRSFLKQVPEDVVVVVDEAYHDYVNAGDYESVLEMRELRERVIVTRTFSKCYGMAGVRAGYGIAPPEMIDRMNRVREPFNCNLLVQAAVPAALSDREFVERSVTVNEEGRAVLEKGLAELSDLGVDWIPSQTNFLLVKVPVEGRKVYDAMLRKGVIVRPMGGYGLPEYLRISLAEEAKMTRCLVAMEEAIREVSA